MRLSAHLIAVALEGMSSALQEDLLRQHDVGVSCKPHLMVASVIDDSRLYRY